MSILKYSSAINTPQLQVKLLVLKSCCFFKSSVQSTSNSCSVRLSDHGQAWKAETAAVFCFVCPYVWVLHWPVCDQTAFFGYKDADERLRY